MRADTLSQPLCHSIVALVVEVVSWEGRLEGGMVKTPAAVLVLLKEQEYNLSAELEKLGNTHTNQNTSPIPPR